MTIGIFGILALAASLGSCATTKALQSIGGSKADGIVKMAYEYGSFESPVPQLEQAKKEAASRCRAWGYSDAEPFGAGTSQCLESNQYGCLYARVTYEYQCLGDNSVPPKKRP